MSFTIASWNAESRLSDRGIIGRGSPMQIAEEILKLHADVVVLPEAYDPTKGVYAAAMNILNTHYKTIIDIPYNDDEIKTDPFSPSKELVIRFMTRLDLKKSAVIRLADKRDTPYFTVIDPATSKEITIFAVHLDDKYKVRRIKQLDQLSEVINKRGTNTIMIGDFNTSTGKSFGARLLRLSTTTVVASIIPSAHIRNILKRAIEMSSGDELQHLEMTTSLRNIDPKGKPTTTPKMFGKPQALPSIRFLDIDHLYASPAVKVENFTIMHHDGGSDHRAITATISL